MKVLVFDTETTGLPKSRSSLILDPNDWPYIVQIGWILYDTDTKQIISIEDHIINCVIDIPEESTKIHGITNKISKTKGIDINLAMNAFEFSLNNADLLIAHNISFDKRVYLAECLRNNRKLIFNNDKKQISEYCTMNSSKKICNIKAISKTGKEYIKFPTLSELHYHLFGSIPKGTHNAMADILICLRCYLFIENNFDVMCGNSNIAKLYRLYTE